MALWVLDSVWRNGEDRSGETRQHPRESLPVEEERSGEQ